jgi:hypothetical protein
MSRLVIGSRAALIAALRKQVAERGGAAAGAGAAALAEEARALAEELFLDALFLVAQFPGGQIPEAEKCCYAYDVRLCAGLCRATWAEEAFWSGLVRVSHPGPGKLTRLIYAADRGDAVRVVWLLARGAPTEAKDARGQTALHVASMSGYGYASLIKPKLSVDTVRVLLSAGAKVDAATNDGKTPLWNAAQYGQTNAMRELLAAGANVDVASSCGRRPLHIALFKDSIMSPLFSTMDAVKLLLNAGADVNALDKDGKSPLDYARNPKIRALIIARGGV